VPRELWDSLSPDDVVSIKYLPENPKQFKVEYVGGYPNWIGFALAAIFLGIAAVMSLDLYRDIKRQRQGRPLP